MTAESSAAQSPAPEERDSRAMIAIAGIGAGGAILLALVALATVVLRRSRRSVKTAEALVPLPDTESLEALLARAGRETASGNYNLARVLLRQAIARAPQDSAVRLHLLEVEFAQKDGPSFAADAAELQEMLQGSDPELWEKVAAMGLILCPDQPLFRGKEVEVAGPQEIEERIPAFEESAEMLVARADQEATAGNHNLARAILRRAISRQPRNPEIRLKLLKIEYSQKDGLSFAADAEELWTLPDIEESPLWEQVHQMGRELCPEQPLFRESLEGEVPAPAPAPRAHAESLEELLLRADQEATAGNYNLARAILRQAITRDPGDPELRVKLLTVEYAQKDGPSFTADAEELRTVLKSGESGIWEKVAAMGRALRPDQPLFQ
jgi:Tfp pilus assembly protein FimV